MTYFIAHNIIFMMPENKSTLNVFDAREIDKSKFDSNKNFVQNTYEIGSYQHLISG